MNKGASASDELRELRDSIDNVDAALVYLLAERFKFTKRVGEIKATQSAPAIDPVRESNQILRIRAISDAARLDPNFAENFQIATSFTELFRLAAQRYRDGQWHPALDPGMTSLCDTLVAERVVR